MITALEAAVSFIYLFVMLKAGTGKALGHDLALKAWVGSGISNV